MTAGIVLVIVLIPMLVEAGLAARNERAQRARGGVEPRGDAYPLMRFVYPGAFAAMVWESWSRGSPSVGWFVAGLVLFAVAKALKWWAIRSLGAFWTFRVIIVPGTRLVKTGPYKYVRHPNYIAVVAELVSVMMMTGARVAGPIAIIAFGLLLLKRISIEQRALDAILRET